MEETRICKTCQIEKPLGAPFYTRVASKPGGNVCWHRACKECRSAAIAENRKRLRQDPEYVAKMRADAARWKAGRTPEQVARAKEWSRLHYAKQVAGGLIPEINAKVRARKQRRTDAERLRDVLVRAAYNAAGRIKKLRGEVEFVNPTALAELLAASHGVCAYCTRPHDNNIALDHVIPVSRGGANAVENLVVTCKLCNILKNRRTPDEWLGVGWEARRSAMLCNVQPNNYSIAGGMSNG